MNTDNHYRKFDFVTPVSYKQAKDGEMVIKCDPYFICELYKIGGGPLEHMLKKILRGSSKGHSHKQLLDELQASLNRAYELLELFPKES